MCHSQVQEGSSVMFSVFRRIIACSSLDVHIQARQNIVIFCQFSWGGEAFFRQILGWSMDFVVQKPLSR